MSQSHVTQQINGAPDPVVVAQAEKQITETNRADHPLVYHLQRQLANLLMLYLNYKKCHWQVAGPAFRDHHLTFGEFAADTEESLDEVAERIRMIGQDPEITLLGIEQRAIVRPVHNSRDVGLLSDDLDQNLIVVIKEFRKASRAADEADDPGTVDLLGKVLRMLEKQEWYLREMAKTTAA